MDISYNENSQHKITLEDHKEFLQTSLQNLRTNIEQTLLLRRRVARLALELAKSNSTVLMEDIQRLPSANLLIELHRRNMTLVTFHIKVCNIFNK